MFLFRNKLAVICILFFFSACKKETISLSYTELNTGVDTRIRSIYFQNETTGFVCGGEKIQSGIILKTSDGGINWQQVYSSSLAIRDITFVTDSLGFACGDSLLILKTTDGGNSWNKMNLPYTPVNVVPFTSIQFRDAQHGNVCGGENWEKGITMRTTDAGSWWENECFYNTEVSESYFVNDTVGYIAANGAVYKATADVHINNLLSLSGDFFTSVYFTSPDEGFVCGYDGGIYKTSNAGATWKQVRKDNTAFTARTHFNKIRFSGTEKGFAVGSNGAVFYSSDSGESWKQSDNFPDENILSVFILNTTTAFASGDGGKLYRISF